MYTEFILHVTDLTPREINPSKGRLRKQTEYMFGVLYRELPW